MGNSDVVKTSLEILKQIEDRIRAANPQFGCLMAMLPSLETSIPNWAADNISSSDLAGDGVETETHCTILYGFNLEFDSGKLKQILADVQPFKIKLTKLERFECDDYDVIKFTVKSPELVALNKKISAEFSSEITPSEYSYNPHVTVAYVKKGSAKNLDASKFEGTTATVQQMLFSLPDEKGRVVFNLGEPIHASLPRLLAIESLSRRLPAIIYAKKPDKHAKLKKVHNQIRDQAEAIYRAHIKNVLTVAQAELLHRIRTSYKPQGSVQASGSVRSSVSGNKTPYNRSSEVVKAALPSNLMFDLDAFSKSFLSAMRSAGQAAFSVTSRGLSSELGIGERETDDGIVREFLNTRENKISGCPDIIYDQIKKSLREGVDAGETMDELSQRVQDEFEDADKVRGALIAATESQSVYGTAQMDSLEAGGFSTKGWQTSDDELVRESHMACEEQGPIDADEDFENGLKYPGDPDGEASEVIGCRCYLIPGNENEGLTEEDIAEINAREQLVNRVEKILAGDVPGHEFHGNQWTDKGDFYEGVKPEVQKKVEAKLNQFYGEVKSASNEYAEHIYQPKDERNDDSDASAWKRYSDRLEAAKENLKKSSGDGVNYSAWIKQSGSVKDSESVYVTVEVSDDEAEPIYDVTDKRFSQHSVRALNRKEAYA